MRGARQWNFAKDQRITRTTDDWISKYVHGRQIFFLLNFFSHIYFLESISPTFCERNCANFFAPVKNLTFPSITKKFCTKLLYKKDVHKMLMKLTPSRTFCSALHPIEAAVLRRKSSSCIEGDLHSMVENIQRRERHIENLIWFFYRVKAAEYNCWTKKQNKYLDVIFRLARDKLETQLVEKCPLWF